MECKRDRFSAALGRASETHSECVSHHLNVKSSTPQIKLIFQMFLVTKKIHTLRASTEATEWREELARHRTLPISTENTRTSHKLLIS